MKVKIMMETIEVKEFLRTGNFGEFKEIYYGMKRNDLVEILGDTEWKHFSSKKSKSPSIYKYGQVEFYFEESEDGRLMGIQILPTIQEAESMNLKINYDFITSNLDYESTLKYLDSESIKYKKVRSEFDSQDIRRIETGGKVQLIFSEDFKESISIHKVSKFIPLNSNQRKEKQISFSIPELEYEELKILAKKYKKSISKICVEIIIDQLKKE